MFVSAQVVSLLMMLHRLSVSMCGNIMKFGGFAMRIVHVVDLNLKLG